MVYLEPIAGVQRDCNTNLQLLEAKSTLGRFSKHSQALESPETSNHPFPLLDSSSLVDRAS